MPMERDHFRGQSDMQSTVPGVKTYFGALLVLWTIAVAGLYAYSALHARRSAEFLAAGAALAYLDKDQAIRLWAASHGGVYVPVSGETQPNPFLSHVVDRDITTPSGRLLTLMNPAYMIRQVMEHYARFSDVQGRITSLRYFRKETAPDEWESRMLSSFEDGRAEAMEFTTVGGEPRLRVIRALYTEDSCLKCHGVQGERLGDVRGGISVSVPLHDYLEFGRKETLAHAASFGLLWVFGLGAIGCVGRRLACGLRERDRAEALLRVWQDNYRNLIDSSMTGIYISQDNTIKFANAKFAEIHGFGVDELPGMDALSLVFPEDRIIAEEVANKRLRGMNAPEEYEIRCTTKSGKVIWVQRRSTLIEHDGRPAILGNEIDVTLRKQADLELKASEDLLKRLSGQLLQFQDAERKAMAREFNENVAQCLSAVKLRAEAMLPLDERAGPAEMTDALKQIIGDLETTVSVVRDMTRRLSPLMVDDLGIVPAIQWLCRSQSHAAPDVRIRTDIQAAESSIPAWLKADIFHVLERILPPAVAGGRASSIRISVRSTNDSLQLKITDNAETLNPQNPPADMSALGVDFAAVKSRVVARGGSVRWKPRPGSGNVVTVVWPLKDV
jgi:two-component system, chemotaxis family, sensor kinase Cph1